MNPPCAKCKKTVYPVEKLNCLDKVGVAMKSLTTVLCVCVFGCFKLAIAGILWPVYLPISPLASYWSGDKPFCKGKKLASHHGVSSGCSQLAWLAMEHLQCLLWCLQSCLEELLCSFLFQLSFSHKADPCGSHFGPVHPTLVYAFS